MYKTILTERDTGQIDTPTAVKSAAAITQEQFTDPADRAKELLTLYHSMPNGMAFEHVRELALQCAEEILAHWLPEGEQKGNEYVAINPTRDDSSAGSFKVNLGKGIWADFATGDRGTDLISLIAYLEQEITQTQAATKILEFLAGMRTDDGIRIAQRVTAKKSSPKPEFTVVMPIPDSAVTSRPTSFSGELGEPATTWEYRDADGGISFYVLRFNTPEGKTIRQLTYCEDATGRRQWKMKAPPSPRPAYGLDRLAARADAPVLFTEGEKTADAAQRLFPDFVAVTTMGGAMAPDRTDFRPFAGRSVYIAQDNDEVGTAYKDKLLDLLAAAGAVVAGTMKLDMLVRDGKPLAKGYDLADAEVDGWTSDELAGIGEQLWEPFAENVSAETEPDEQLPANFFMAADGLHFLKMTEKAATDYWICSPIKVTAHARNEESKNWGKLLTFKDAAGVGHEWALPAEMLAGTGQDYREVLMSYGASISTGSFERTMFGSYLQLCNPKRMLLSVSQPGWNGSNFILGNRAYGPNANEVVFQTRSPAAYAMYAQGGTFDAWKANVAMPARGNSRLILAICASLAGPTLHLTKEESGGFHFRGRSSIGKSIAMNAAASVWGSRSYLVQWNSTDNGLEAIAGRYNDTLLGLDELGEMDPAKAGKVAYMLANGQGKVRADIHADAKDTRKWRVMILSTGEVSLASHMASAGQTIKAGQETRLVDIPADAGNNMGIFDTIHDAASPAEYVNFIRESAFQNFGHAGAAFVTILTDPKVQPDIVSEILAGMESFKKAYIPSGADGQVVRVGHRFALVAAVGEVCINLGILPWQAGEAVAGINACYQSWIGNRGGTGNLEADQIVAQVRRFIEQHGESRFAEMGIDGIDSGDSTRTINRVGLRKSAGDDGTDYFIFPQMYKSEVCQGQDPTYVTQVLAERGFLKVGSDGKRTVVIRLAKNLTKRVYHLLPHVMGDDETVEKPVATQVISRML